MTEPLISVIVPVYNVEPYLNRCVESIVNQTYQNLQIILVDDGSPDNCPAMCDVWVEKDSRIQVIHKQNGGLSDARNAGLAVVEGDYVSFIDSDDWLDLRFFEILYYTANENDCEVAECGYVLTTGEKYDNNRVSAASVYTSEEAMELHLRDSLFRQVVWNKLYRRDVVTVYFEKGKYHEDVFWTYQIIANCQKLAHVDVILYYYFQREGSIMGQDYSLKRLDAVEAFARRCKFVMERFPKLTGLVKQKMVSNCMYHYQLLLKSPLIDPEGNHKKWLYCQAQQGDQFWQYATGLSVIQQIWLRCFLKMPNIICRIRNYLKIGF